MLIQNQGVLSSPDKIQQVVSVTTWVLDMQIELAHGFLRSVKLILSKITGLLEWITSSKKAFSRYLMSSRLWIRVKIVSIRLSMTKNYLKRAWHLQYIHILVKEGKEAIAKKRDWSICCSMTRQSARRTSPKLKRSVISRTWTQASHTSRTNF